MNVKITRRELTKEPVSELLYGNFIEFGYGQQLEAMGAELLFNRSFETFPPYTAINKECYKLYLEENSHGKGYEKDWSVYDWHHSGYEHSAWHVAPAPTPSRLIGDESTFFVCSSPLRQTRLELLPGGVHGSQYVRLDNGMESRASGLAQAGLYVRQGGEYSFSGYFACIKGKGILEVSLYPEGDYSQPCACARIENISCEMQKFDVTLMSGYTGYATFVAWSEPSSILTFDGFSLMDMNNVAGWRRDAVQCLKNDLKPSVMRWPGGCFASFYDFSDGIGENRMPRPSWFWGGLNYNDIGSAEMGALCRKIGAEQMICLNMYHPSKAEYDNYRNKQTQHRHGFNLPQFSNETDGIANALLWADYVNGGDDTEMGALRKRHGYPEPFHTVYWEMDNEAFRWFGWEEYANSCVKYSRALKKAYSYVKTGMISYDHFDEPLEKMLAIAGEDIDFLADRGVTQENLDRKLSIIRSYNREHGTCIKYCNTEWLPYDLIQLAPGGEQAIRSNTSYVFTKWRHALNIFKEFMMFQREDDLMFVNFNNIANTHGQNAIEVTKDATYLNTAGEALSMLSCSSARRVLAAEGYKPCLWDNRQAQAAWDLDRMKLVLYMLNVTDMPEQMEFDLDLLGRRFNRADVQILGADGPLTMNRQSRRSVKRFCHTESGDFSRGYKLEVPEWSFTEIVLSSFDGNFMAESDFLIKASDLKLNFTYPAGNRQMKMNLEDFSEWQDRAGKKLRDLLRFDPRPDYDAPRTLRRMKLPGHTLSALVMNAGEVQLPAYLLTPDDTQPFLPPVIAVQGHGRVAGVIGLEEDYHHGFARALCLTGRTVLAVELRGFEALVDLAANRSQCRLDYGNWGKHMAFTLVTDAFQKGRTLLGDSVSDLLAWSDWLVKRMGTEAYDAAGISYGGDCVLCLAALDGRLRRSFISGSFGSFGPIFDTCYNLPAHCIPDILNWLDRADIAALIAPRPIMLHFGALDTPAPGNFSASYNSTVGPAFEELKRAYAVSGSGLAELFVSKGLEHEMDNEALIGFLNRKGI